MTVQADGRSRYTQPKYYVVGDDKQLVRVHGLGGPAEIFRPDQKWFQMDDLAAKVTGMGGDSDFDGPFTEAQVRPHYPAAF